MGKIIQNIVNFQNLYGGAIVVVKEWDHFDKIISLDLSNVIPIMESKFDVDSFKGGDYAVLFTNKNQEGLSESLKLEVMAHNDKILRRGLKRG